MYFLETNKSTKNKTKAKNIRTKGKALLLSLFALLWALNPVAAYAAYDDVSPYPVYRGVANPQENLARLTLGDAAGLDEVYFVVGTEIMSAPGGLFSPNRPMSQAQGLAAVINASKLRGEVESDPQNWKTGYIDMGTQMGLITEAEIAGQGNAVLDAPLTASQYVQWLSKVTGTQVTYTQQPTAPINRFTAAKIMYDNRQPILDNLGYTHITGDIVDRKTIQEDGRNKTLLTIRQATGGYANILSNRDFPIVRGNVSLDPGVLTGDQSPSFYYKDNGIQFATQENFTTGIASGSFQSLTGDSISLLDYNNVMRSYKLHPEVTYYQAEGEPGAVTMQKPMDKNDFIFGQDMEISLRNNMAIEIRTFIPRDPDLDGYVPIMSQLVTGVATSITNDSITLDGNKVLALTPDTMVMKDGVLSDYRSITEGDKVKLYKDDIYTNVVSRVEIEGTQRQVDTIVKGTIDSYAPGRGELILRSVSQLSGDRWVPATTDYSKIRLQGAVYDGGRRVTTTTMNDYKGQEIYLALSKNQGTPSIEKGNIRRGPAFSFSDEIRSVDFAGGHINIQTNLINYTAGTLVVKDGRLVPEGNIQQGVSAYVESGTTQNASLIVLHGAGYKDEIKNAIYTIYRGTLRDILDYSIQLGNDKDERIYYKLQGLSWTTDRADSTQPRISYSDSTRIFDADANSGKGIEMPVKDFRELKYEGSRYDKAPSWEDRQIYVVTKDGRALSIVFLSQTGYTEVNTQNVLIGKVESVDAAAGTMTITDISKYNGLRGILIPQSTKEVMNLKNASIVKGDKAIPYSAAGNLTGQRVRVVYKHNNTGPGNAIAVISE